MVQPQSHVPSSSALLSTADLEETLEAARRQHLLNVNAPDSGMQVHCLMLLMHLLSCVRPFQWENDQSVTVGLTTSES